MPVDLSIVLRIKRTLKWNGGLISPLLQDWSVSEACFKALEHSLGWQMSNRMIRRIISSPNSPPSSKDCALKWYGVSFLPSIHQHSQWISRRYDTAYHFNVLKRLLFRQFRDFVCIQNTESCGVPATILELRLQIFSAGSRKTILWKERRKLGSRKIKKKERTKKGLIFEEEGTG